jgi:hypothetical protein
MRTHASLSESATRIPAAVALTTLAVGLVVVAYMVGIEVRHRDFRTLDATIRFVGVEGGCWLLETPEQHFNVDLEKRFQIDGARVVAIIEPIPDAISICQIGPIARVKNITFKGDAMAPNHSLERSHDR